MDANAFYSYFGREKLGMSSSPVNEVQLATYLDRKKEKSLPTSVFIEIMTHFRNNPKILKEMLIFRQKKGLPLYNNFPDRVLDANELKCVSLIDGPLLRIYANNLLKRKIEIESKFTLLFFEITKDLYAHYKLESTSELSQDNKDSILNYIGKTQYKEYGELLKEKIKKELDNGYTYNKEQNILKNFYIQELNESCILTNIIIDGCIAVNNEETDMINVIEKAYQKSITLGMDGKNGTMPCVVNTLINDQHFLKSAKTRISEMLKAGNYTDTQRAYLREVMFTAWFERGQKLQKNDIFDMFCVGCLDYVDKEKKDFVVIDSSSYLITFDKKMKTFLGNIRPANLKIIENILNE